ncbi:hypothetical protein J7M00_03960 [bacterium]|nr:hypothetical protein [bacterium]
MEKGKLHKGAPYRILQLLRMYKKVEKDSKKTSYHPALFARIRQYLYRVTGNVKNEEDNRRAAELAQQIEETIGKGEGMKTVEVTLNWCALSQRRGNKRRGK